MTSTSRSFRPPLATLPLACTLAAVLASGCATDPNTGAQSIAGVKVSDDPCAKTATVVGGVLGAVTGAVVASQLSKGTDAKVLGGIAGGGLGAAIGYNIDQRRCALYAIARQHGAELNVSPVVIPKGELPAAATVAAATPGADGRATSATPFAPGGDNATVGLSVTLKDTGHQFASGSDQLSPEAEALFREIADQYAYSKQQAKLTAQSSDDDRAAVEALRGKRILLVGHTDDVGGSAANANLSERRAASVARVFQQEGVPASALFFQGAGETLPVADNRNEDGRAANRRVEIVDLSDDAAFHKFLATRRQNLQYYRINGAAPGTTVADATPAPAKGRKSAAKGKLGFVDFGGVPAATLAAAPDFGAGTAGAGATGAPVPASVAAGIGPDITAADRPVVPTCSADRPRVANGVKSLATRDDLPMSDYVPGLYNTSWSDTVNGHLVGLTGVDVVRDGGAATTRPTLLIWKNYNPKKKIPAADFSTMPDVNVYRGSKAILYRVFVGGPMKCMDVLFPYTATGDARNSSLFYDHQNTLYVSTFEFKSLNGAP